MTQLFGTDGVRGKAGDAPLDALTIRRLGAALVRVLRLALSERSESNGHDEAVTAGAARPVSK